MQIRCLLLDLRELAQIELFLLLTRNNEGDLHLGGSVVVLRLIVFLDIFKKLNNFYLKIFLKIEYVYVGFLDQLSLVFVEVVPVVFVDVYLDLILSLLVEELLISVEINACINYDLNVPSTT